LSTVIANGSGPETRGGSGDIAAVRVSATWATTPRLSTTDDPLEIIDHREIADSDNSRWIVGCW